jgi:hypothetical protein
MEDFNTGTLPHKKYYDLDAYERRRAAKAASKGAAAVRPPEAAACALWLGAVPVAARLAAGKSTQRRQSARSCVRAARQGGELSAFDDEAALKAERKAAAAEAASDRLREAYNELKYTAAGKVGRPTPDWHSFPTHSGKACACLAHALQQLRWLDLRLRQVADMREQEMTRMQMNLAYRTADFETARKLQSRLAPDDPFADPNAAKRIEK